MYCFHENKGFNNQYGSVFCVDYTYVKNLKIAWGLPLCPLVPQICKLILNVFFSLTMLSKYLVRVSHNRKKIPVLENRFLYLRKRI